VCRLSSRENSVLILFIIIIFIRHNGGRTIAIKNKNGNKADFDMFETAKTVLRVFAFLFISYVHRRLKFKKKHRLISVLFQLCD